MRRFVQTALLCASLFGFGIPGAVAVDSARNVYIADLGVCRNEKGDMRFGNRVIRIGEAGAGHFSTTERGERRDRG